MTVHRNSTHEKQVQAWEKENTQGLRPDQLVQLFGSAIQAIEQRSLVTLSIVTVQVVVDRALHESLGKFPLLSAVQLEPQGLNFSGLVQTSEHTKADDVRDALRHFLVELLNVLGNITADVLTDPLHKELMGVTCERALKTSEVQNLQSRNTSKTKRGES